MGYQLEKVLMCTACEIAVFGWMSRKLSEVVGTPPTKYWVKEILCKTQLGMQRQKELLSIAKDRDIDLYDPSRSDTVAKAIEWARNLNINSSGLTLVSSSQTFEEVVKTIATMGDVDDREFGYAVAILPTYQTLIVNSASEHLDGALGAPIDLEVTVSKITDDVNRRWWLINVLTDDGKKLKWFSKDDPYAMSPLFVGKKIRIKGVIDKHEEFRGMKSTKLKRVVIHSLTPTPIPGVTP